MLNDFAALTSYSQYGEDLVAFHLLDALGISQGCYVDIGCGHPVEFNNTYFFYLRGWRGLNVDPDVSFETLYAELRPEDSYLNAAVSTEEKPLTYYQFSPYLYSTCDEARADILRQDPNVKFLRKLDVPGRSLAKLIAEYEAHLQDSLSIDFMSIDVEGLEIEVLKSHDWNSFRPKVLALEVLGLKKAQGLLNTPSYCFLRAQEYRLKAMTQSTFFFVDATSEHFNANPELPLGGAIG